MFSFVSLGCSYVFLLFFLGNMISHEEVTTNNNEKKYPEIPRSVYRMCVTQAVNSDPTRHVHVTLAIVVPHVDTLAVR